MFPIPWNRLFRKKDGSLVNIEEAMSGGGGGGGASGGVQITSYTTNLRGSNANVFDVSSEAPSSASRLIGVVSNLAYHNKVVSGSTIASTVGLCFDNYTGNNPNCFYCAVQNDVSNVKFDLIWWVPSAT